MSTVVDETEREEAKSGHRHLGLALVVISIAQLMVVLDATIVNIAIPYVSKDLDIGTADRQWIITAYTLSFGGLLLLGGRLGDIFGRRRVFMIGVTLFGFASLLGGLAQTESMLFGARILQGVGAAIASPTALALITTTFPPGKPRNRAFAVYAAMSGAGAAVGLVLGGWLTEYSWRWTLLINVPIGLFAAAAAPFVLAESARHRGAFDLGGALTGTLGLVSIVYGLTHASQLVSANAQHTWTAPATMLALGLGVALLVSFLVIERRIKDPLMPFRILADRTRATSFAVMMLIPAGMFAMFFFLSQVVQTVLGYSSLKAGFAFLPFSAGIVVSAGIASNLMSRVDPRWLAGVGSLIATVGIFGFSRIGYDSTTLTVNATYVKDLLPWILVMSFGMGFVFVPLTVTAVHGVGERDSGIGSGVLNAMQQIGGSLGLAVLSTVAVTATQNKADVIASQLRHGGITPAGSPQDVKTQLAHVAFTHGSTIAFMVGSVMIGLGAVLVFAFMRVSHRELATDGPSGLPGATAAEPEGEPATVPVS
jgi:EmrB/QacA subfamily drug resistance transporter